MSKKPEFWRDVIGEVFSPRLGHFYSLSCGHRHPALIGVVKPPLRLECKGCRVAGQREGMLPGVAWPERRGELSLKS